MAAPSEPAWAAVATAGHLTITEPLAPPTRAAHPAVRACRRLHTYLPTGTQLCWRHDLAGTWALDAEPAAAVVPPALAARWPTPPTGFWTAWVRAEVIAKLTGTPVLPLVAKGFPVPDDPRVETLTRTVTGIVVCFGRLRAAP